MTRKKSELQKRKVSYAVARDEQGRELERKRLKSDETLTEAFSEFKKRGTWKEDVDRVERVDLTKVRETSIYDGQHVPKRVMKYQYFVHVHFTRSGRDVWGASMLHPQSFPVNKAKSEAYENVHLRIGEQITDRYDEDVGKGILDVMDSKEFSKEEGIKFYESISS